MSMPLWSQPRATIDLNHLRRGRRYRAHTLADRLVVGVYLGIEVAYDDWSILLDTGAGTESIPVYELAAIEPAGM